MRPEQPEGLDEPCRLPDLALQLEAVSGTDEEVHGEADEEERDDGGRTVKVFWSIKLLFTVIKESSLL